MINNIRELNNATPEDSSSSLFLEAYKMFIDKYCAGNDNTQPAIATAYRKIREYGRNACYYLFVAHVLQAK